LSEKEKIFNTKAMVTCKKSAAVVKKLTNVHVVLGSQLRPCKPSASDLTIANTWVRSSS